MTAQRWSWMRRTPGASTPSRRSNATLKVSDAAGKLLTVIEILSPSNKVEPGLDRFRRNRSEVMAAGVHWVEIDLVRGGDWRGLMAPTRCPMSASSPYRALARTAGPDGSAYLYPIRLREPLPDVQVPLRAGVPPAVLPLQAMLTAAYDDGRYGTSVDYARPPDPPLPARRRRLGRRPARRPVALSLACR